MQNYQ
jgi:hypothetical protein